jgi:hypothetical protein
MSRSMSLMPCAGVCPDGFIQNTATLVRTMKLHSLFKGLPRGLSGLRLHALSIGIGLAGMAILPGTLLAQSDDFEDNNDTGWTRYDPIGSHPQLPDIATFTVTGGKYRIQTAPSPDPGSLGPGRSGSLREDVIYTDFYVQVDLVDWDEALDQSVGIMGRITQTGLGTTDGYAMTYNFGGDDIDITRFTDEDPNGGNLSVTGNDSVVLEKGKSYRLVFWGKGPTLGARVYELSDLETPLADITGTDATYPSGICGLIVYDNTSAANGTTDATFDNYFAAEVQPPKLELVDLFFNALQLHWPGDAAAFKLEWTDKLPATATEWTEISEDSIVYASDIDRFIYQFDSSEGTKFFRLRR